MASLNKWAGIGRLGKDPKLAYLPSGNPVAEFSVACDESYKDKEGNKQERTEWVNIKVFGKSAEFCGKYLGKGRLVYVEGRLSTRKWQDKDGNDRYMTEIVVSGPGHTVTALDKGTQGGGQDAPKQDGYQHFPSDSSGMSDVPFSFFLIPAAAFLAHVTGVLA